MQAGTKQVYEMQTIRAEPYRLQHTRVHIECKVIVLCTLQVNNSCKLKVQMY
jgi:hypothetical protein